MLSGAMEQHWQVVEDGTGVFPIESDSGAARGLIAGTQAAAGSLLVEVYPRAVPLIFLFLLAGESIVVVKRRARPATGKISKWKISPLDHDLCCAWPLSGGQICWCFYR